MLAAGALYLLNPDYVSILFIDPAGQKILAVAVVMLVISFVLLLVINALQAWQRRRAGVGV